MNNPPTERETLDKAWDLCVRDVWVFFAGFALGVAAMTALVCTLAPYLIR